MSRSGIKDGETRDVPLSNVWTLPTYANPLNPKTVDAFVQNPNAFPDARPPHALVGENRDFPEHVKLTQVPPDPAHPLYFVQDGTHRSHAAARRGDKTLRYKVDRCRWSELFRDEVNKELRSPEAVSSREKFITSNPGLSPELVRLIRESGMKKTEMKDRIRRLYERRPDLEPSSEFKKRDLDPSAGYIISHDLEPGGEYVSVSTHLNGERVGVLDAGISSAQPGTLFPIMVKVHEKHRRRGIATAMYQHAEKVMGMKFAPSNLQSKDAKKLWAQPGRPFGKAESKLPAPGPMTIRFARNQGGKGAENYGTRFGQDVEPHGVYMVDTEGSRNPNPPPGWVEGDVTFQNPLHIEWGGGYEDPTNWKRVLAAKYGKKGRALSQHLLSLGHDAIVTWDKNGHTSEIVHLAPLLKKGEQLPEPGEFIPQATWTEQDWQQYAETLEKAVRAAPGQLGLPGIGQDVPLTPEQQAEADQRQRAEMERLIAAGQLPRNQWGATWHERAQAGKLYPEEIDEMLQRVSLQHGSDPHVPGFASEERPELSNNNIQHFLTTTWDRFTPEQRSNLLDVALRPNPRAWPNEDIERWARRNHTRLSDDEFKRVIPLLDRYDLEDGLPEQRAGILLDHALAQTDDGDVENPDGDGWSNPHDHAWELAAMAARHVNSPQLASRYVDGMPRGNPFRDQTMKRLVMTGSLTDEQMERLWDEVEPQDAPDFGLANALAQHARTEHLQDRIRLHSKNGTTNSLLRLNQHLAVPFAAQVLHHGSTYDAKLLLSNPALPSQVVSAALVHKDRDVRKLAVEHPLMPEDKLRDAAEHDRRREVRQAAAKALEWHDPSSVHPEHVEVKFGTNKLRQVRDFIQGSGREEVRPAELPAGDWKVGRVSNGNISAKKLQEHIDSLPSIRYGVSEGLWKGAQRHSSEPSYVFQLNLSTDQVRQLKQAGVWETFRKMHEASRMSSHPVGHAGIGWVRWTGGRVDRTTGKPAGIHIDEVQSDLGQSFIRQAANQAAAHGMDPNEAAARAARDYPEEHYQRIKDIVFGGKHPSEVLHEAFHQWLRQGKNFKHYKGVNGLGQHPIDPYSGRAPMVGAPVAVWQPEAKATISLGRSDEKLPGHFYVGYRDVPKKMGMKPALYGALPTQANQKHSGKQTWTDEVRKSEDPNPPRAASVLVFNGRGEVLWGRRQRDGKWTLPGGHLEAGEDPHSGALRELWEEAGLVPHSIQHLGTANTDAHIPVFMYQAHVLAGQPTSANDPDHEVASWHWVNCLMGLLPELAQNLAHPRNVLVEHMGWTPEPQPGMMVGMAKSEPRGIHPAHLQLLQRLSEGFQKLYPDAAGSCEDIAFTVAHAASHLGHPTHAIYGSAVGSDDPDQESGPHVWLEANNQRFDPKEYLASRTKAPFTYSRHEFGERLGARGWGEPDERTRKLIEHVTRMTKAEPVVEVLHRAHPDEPARAAGVRPGRSACGQKDVTVAVGPLMTKDLATDAALRTSWDETAGHPRRWTACPDCSKE